MRAMVPCAMGMVLLCWYLRAGGRRRPGRSGGTALPVGVGSCGRMAPRQPQFRGRWHFMMADGCELERRPGMSIRGIVAWLQRATNTVHIEP